MSHRHESKIEVTVGEKTNVLLEHLQRVDIVLVGLNALRVLECIRHLSTVLCALPLNRPVRKLTVNQVKILSSVPSMIETTSLFVLKPDVCSITRTMFNSFSA